jgi:hypothetical protein
MRKLAQALVVVMLLSTAAVTQAQGPVTVTFDEKGGGGLPFTLAPDPTFPAGPVLTYTLPFPVAPGDVLLFNPADTTGPGGGQPAPQSDLVRFISSDPFVGGAPAVLFYSDLGDSGEIPDLADIGLPPFTGAVVIPEVGPESSNGAIYTPGAGAPGSTPAAAVTYSIISDTPEPSSIVLLVIGAGTFAVGFVRRRRRR